MSHDHTDRSRRDPRPPHSPEQQPDDLTVLLNQAQSGDADAAREAWSRIYGELRQMAASAASKEAYPTDATSIVSEAYMRVAGNEHWDNRRHFFGAMRLAMSRLLIDRARRRGARPDLQKSRRRSPELVEGELESFDVASSESGLALLEALEQLAEADPDAAEVVHLRYIEQRTIEQTAEMLGCSPGTVKNRWRAARAFLRERIESALDGPPDEVLQ